MAFPQPSGADHYDCSPFFALKNVEPADCRTAFSMLPVGTQPILFKNNPDEGDPYGLPFTVTHETCNIRFQVAGPAAERLDIVPFVPNDMRNMAGWVYEECVEDESGTQGGWVSKELSNTIDYLTDPESDIAGFFLDWPPNTSFFTVMIWDVNPETATDPERDFSPGDNDPILGNFILQDLETAMDSAEEGSHAKQELRMRFEYVDRAVDNMHRDEEYHRWWDYYAPQLALSLVNATSPCGEKPSGSVGSNCSQLLQSG